MEGRSVSVLQSVNKSVRPAFSVIPTPNSKTSGAPLLTAEASRKAQLHPCRLLGYCCFRLACISRLEGDAFIHFSSVHNVGEFILLMRLLSAVWSGWSERGVTVAISYNNQLSAVECSSCVDLRLFFRLSTCVINGENNLYSPQDVHDKCVLDVALSCGISPLIATK